MESSHPTFSTSYIPSFHPISEKLSESNFLLWRQQVQPVIKVHKLQRFVVNPVIPIQFLTEDDRAEGNENLAYSTWEQQDQVLLSWLQSTLSSSILSRLIGCEHSYEVWDQLHDYFQKQTRAKARQLRTKLRTTTLEQKSMSEFLLRIKCLVDALSTSH